MSFDLSTEHHRVLWTNDSCDISYVGGRYSAYLYLRYIKMADHGSLMMYLKIDCLLFVNIDHTLDVNTRDY